MDHTHAPSVGTVCDALGRRRVAHAVGVRLTSVSNAVTAGIFPARWFDVIDGLCRAEGIPCPRSLFAFVRPADLPVANTSEDAA
ncbi:hypothetical protein E2977_14615 [Paracoccus yeei]